MLSSLNCSHSSSSLGHAVARLDFDDSSLNDLVRLDLLYASFQLEKRRESVPRPRLELSRGSPSQPSSVKVLGRGLVLPMQFELDLAAVVDLFPLHRVGPPPQKMIRSIIAKPEPALKGPPAFVGQVPELDDHVSQEIIRPKRVPVVDGDADLRGNETRGLSCDRDDAIAA